MGKNKASLNAMRAKISPACRDFVIVPSICVNLKARIKYILIVINKRL